jgi:hypothetical protein
MARNTAVHLKAELKAVQALLKNGLALISCGNLSSLYHVPPTATAQSPAVQNELCQSCDCSYAYDQRRNDQRTDRLI